MQHSGGQMQDEAVQLAGKDPGEDDEIDQRVEQRIAERPGEAQRRAHVSHLQILGDEVEDEIAPWGMKEICRHRKLCLPGRFNHGALRQDTVLVTVEG